MMPLVFVFLAIGSVVLIFRKFLDHNGIDWEVVSGGNLVIYLITIVSLHMLTKGLDAVSTHAFLRSAYSGILLKLVTCAVAAFIYIAIAKQKVNKPSIFIMMALYLLYTFVEMRIVMKHSKRKPNVEN
jgi:hypothetical protein